MQGITSIGKEGSTTIALPNPSSPQSSSSFGNAVVTASNETNEPRPLDESLISSQSSTNAEIFNDVESNARTTAKGQDTSDLIDKKWTMTFDCIDVLKLLIGRIFVK